MPRRATVSRELVEDLHLWPWVKPLNAWCDRFAIDRRRLKRELRKLPRLRRAAAAAFMSEVRGTHPMAIIYDEFEDQSISPKQKKAILAAWDRALERSIQPAADMSRPALG